MKMKKSLLALTITILGLCASPALAQDPPPDPIEVVDAGAVELAGVAEMPSAVASMTEPAPEAASAPEAKDPIDTAGAVIKDVRSGDWRYAIAGILSLLMLGLAKARDNTDWFSGDRAGALLVLGLGVGGGLVTALYADGPLDWRLLAGAVGTAAMAAGGYTLAKQILWPSDQREG